MSHTPGPWVTQEEAGNTLVVSPSAGVEVAICANNADAQICASALGTLTALEVAEAAMNLMGDALNDMDAGADDPNFDRISKAFEVVRNAIAKARGGR